MSASARKYYSPASFLPKDYAFAVAWAGIGAAAADGAAEPNAHQWDDSDVRALPVDPPLTPLVPEPYYSAYDLEVSDDTPTVDLEPFARMAERLATVEEQADFFRRERRKIRVSDLPSAEHFRPTVRVDETPRSSRPTAVETPRLKRRTLG